MLEHDENTSLQMLLCTHMVQKIAMIIFYSIPIILMIMLIPNIENDYALSIIYSVFIIALLFVKSERDDLSVLIFGFIAITISELFFVSTGVETFTRNSLFGLIPLWLPFLWAYAFITMNRCLKVLDN